MSVCRIHHAATFTQKQDATHHTPYTTLPAQKPLAPCNCAPTSGALLWACGKRRGVSPEAAARVPRRRLPLAPRWWTPDEKRAIYAFKKQVSGVGGRHVC